MQRISVPLTQEVYEALRLRAFNDRQSLALTASKLIAGGLLGRAGRDGLSPGTDEPRRDHMTARTPPTTPARSGVSGVEHTVTPDWKK